MDSFTDEERVHRFFCRWLHKTGWREWGGGRTTGWTHHGATKCTNREREEVRSFSNEGIRIKGDRLDIGEENQAEIEAGSLHGSDSNFESREYQYFYFIAIKQYFFKGLIEKKI